MFQSLELKTVIQLDESSVEVNVRDDNDTSSTPETRISVAQQVVNEILETLGVRTAASETSNAPAILPNVSVVAVATNIDEGSIARFVIASRNGTASTNISVSFQIHHARVQVELPERMEVQLRGQDAVAVAIPTINNDHAGEDGYVAISLKEDPSYLIADNERSATVNISDTIDRRQRQAEITAHAQAFLPEFTGTTSAGNLNIVSNRITQGFAEPITKSLTSEGKILFQD